MPEADMETTVYNPFDVTKVWRHEDYPLIDVGTLELNRNPENYFADLVQAAFSPAIADLSSDLVWDQCSTP